jgi:hypothetical protein
MPESNPSRGSAQTEKEVVDLEDLYKDVGGKQQVRVGKLTGTQWAGFILAVCVGVIILAVIIFIGIDWLSNAPNLSYPDLKNVNQEDIETLSKAIEQYKSINDLAIERVKTLFDSIVINALLPIFTLILGYVFGTQRVERQPEG